MNIATIETTKLMSGINHYENRIVLTTPLVNRIYMPENLPEKAARLRVSALTANRAFTGNP